MATWLSFEWVELGCTSSTERKRAQVVRPTAPHLSGLTEILGPKAKAIVRQKRDEAFASRCEVGPCANIYKHASSMSLVVDVDIRKTCVTASARHAFPSVSLSLPKVFGECREG